MENNVTTLSRLTTSTPKLDAQEIDWWEKYADVEEQFCWVQTPAMQNFFVVNTCSGL
jgi:hypothetical protein